MGIPDHLTCLLRNLDAGQEARVRTGHGTDCFQVGKGVHQGCILLPFIFNLYAEYMMGNAQLDELTDRLWSMRYLKLAISVSTLIFIIKLAYIDISP